MKLREWKGKSWLLIIAHLRIKLYWMACKSGRFWLLVLEWVCLCVIYNRYQFFITFPRYFSPRYYSQKFIGKVVAQMLSFFKICIRQNHKEESDRSSKRDYFVREICRKYTFTVGHPNIAQVWALQIKIIWQIDKGTAFLLIFPTIEKKKKR